MESTDNNTSNSINVCLDDSGKVVGIQQTKVTEHPLKDGFKALHTSVMTAGEATENKAPITQEVFEEVNNPDSPTTIADLVIDKKQAVILEKPASSPAPAPLSEPEVR